MTTEHDPEVHIAVADWNNRKYLKKHAELPTMHSIEEK